MNLTEMEDAINNLDRRMENVEQILPTLATGDGLLATTEDLAAEIHTTRNELRAELQTTANELRTEIHGVRNELRAEIRTTTNELRVEIRATRDELIERVDTVKRHADMRIEDAREDIRKVAEGVASLSTSLQANTRVLEDVVRRLGRHETILETLVRRGS